MKQLKKNTVIRIINKTKIEIVYLLGQVGVIVNLSYNKMYSNNNKVNDIKIWKKGINRDKKIGKNIMR